MKCAECNGDMIKSYVDGDFSAITEDGVCATVNTNKYMCKECGYIKEYAEDSKFYQKRN